MVGLEVYTAEDGDIGSWLILASGVENELGPQVSNPIFQQALVAAVDRRTALCVRENGRPAGSPLAGGLLYAFGGGRYVVEWLAVAASFRRRGVGRALINRLLARADTPAEVAVTVYGAGEPLGAEAREFYLALGFRPSGPSPHRGPRGESLEVLRRPPA